MNFRVTGLSADPFKHLYGMSDAALADHGVKRYVADKSPGFPDRIEMREAAIGETLLLLNHECQPAATPYRATHAIFIREGAERTYDEINAIPEVMRNRLLSVRAFDAAGMMLDADVVAGPHLEPVIHRLFSEPAIAYLHVHNAKHGCYAGRVDRS